MYDQLYDVYDDNFTYARTYVRTLSVTYDDTAVHAAMITAESACTPSMYQRPDLKRPDSPATLLYCSGMNNPVRHKRQRVRTRHERVTSTEIFTSDDYYTAARHNEGVIQL